MITYAQVVDATGISWISRPILKLLPMFALSAMTLSVILNQDAQRAAAGDVSTEFLQNRWAIDNKTAGTALNKYIFSLIR